MNYEKKYKDALERAKEKYAMFEGMKQGDILEDVFPELKESDDERIRKAIHIYLDWLDGRKDYLPKGEYSIRDMIAWIKKQGEHANFRNKIQVGDKVTRNQDGVLVNLSQLNRVAKPDDKVEPKFKVGDFIVNDYCMGKVIELTNNAYLLDTGQGIPFSCEHNAHLWTIQDAKDGDVLSWDDSKCITIFKNIYDEDSFNSYGFVGGCTGTFESRMSYHDVEGAHPATKEQRDLLFSKIKEAGYEWDAEKKELKKIEPKNTDKKGMNLVEEEMTPFQKKVFCIIDTTIEEEQGLKQVCDELLSLAHDEIMQKSAWSEEDEKMFNSALWHIKNSCGNQGKNSGEFEVYNWLKSIKDRYTWKPSDEQINALQTAIGIVGELTSTASLLKEIREQLKKLR